MFISSSVFRAFLCSLALFGTLIIVAPARAQVDLPERRLPGKPPMDYKFRDSDGEILIVGELRKLEGQDVTIADSTGAIHKFKMSVFSKDDRSWIRRQVVEMKRFEDRKEEVNRLARGLFSEKSTAVIKACNRLRNYGVAANHIAATIEDHVKSDDPKVRAAAFICLSAITDPNFANVDRLVRGVNDKDGKILASIEATPERFLVNLSRFEKLVIPYLRNVAFTGKLNSDPAESIDKPQAGLAAGSRELRTRLAACRAVAGTRSGQDAAEILLQVLEIESDKQDNLDVIAKLITDLGTLGHGADEVVLAIESHQAELPEAVKTALGKLNPVPLSSQKKDGKDDGRP